MQENSAKNKIIRFGCKMYDIYIIRDRINMLIFASHWTRGTSTIIHHNYQLRGEHVFLTSLRDLITLRLIKICFACNKIPFFYDSGSASPRLIPLICSQRILLMSEPCRANCNCLRRGSVSRLIFTIHFNDYLWNRGAATRIPMSRIRRETIYRRTSCRVYVVSVYKVSPNYIAGTCCESRFIW